MENGILLNKYNPRTIFRTFEKHSNHYRIYVALFSDRILLRDRRDTDRCISVHTRDRRTHWSIGYEHCPVFSRFVSSPWIFDFTREIDAQ